MIQAITNNDTALTDFQVYEGAVEGMNKLILKDDGQTNKTFNFGETIPLITVTKDTYKDGEYENYTIIDGNNTIAVNMTLQMVNLKQ